MVLQNFTPKPLFGPICLSPPTAYKPVYRPPSVSTYFATRQVDAELLALVTSITNDVLGEDYEQQAHEHHERQAKRAREEEESHWEYLMAPTPGDIWESSA